MILVKRWLLRVILCALLANLAGSFAGKGRALAAVRLVGALTLALTLLQGLRDVPYVLPEADLAQYEESIARLELTLSEAAEETMRGSIEAQTGAYIESKAADMGLPVTVSVTAEESGGVMLPVRAVLHGEKSEELAAYMEQLGITRENQIWITDQTD